MSTQPGVAAVPDDALSRLAREARAEHLAAERAFESAVEHAHRCGHVLLQAKSLCRHGEWLPWLREAGIPARTAQDYMRLAKNADSAHLPETITEALRPRSASSPTSPLRDLCAKLERAITSRPTKTFKAGRESLGSQIAWHEAEAKRLRVQLADLEVELEKRHAKRQAEKLL